MFPTPSLVTSPPVPLRGLQRPPWMWRFPYVPRTLLRRWRGMIGMMLGVGVALSLTMTLLAINQATRELLANDFVLSGADLYAVTRGGKLVALLAGDAPGTVRNARQVIARVRGLPAVTAAVGVMSWPLDREREGPRRRGEPAEQVVTLGVDGDPTAIPGLLLLKEGRWLSRADEIVVGGRFSREKDVGLGATLRLAGRDFTIVGIGRLRGVGSFTADALVYLDYAALQERASFGDVLNAIAIDTSQPDLVRQRLADLGRLTLSTPAELVHQAEQATAADLIGHWILSLLSLSIGALFVSTMLGRSVVERRLEFATLKAIGLPTRTILLLVVLEAIVVCLIATILGVGLSLVTGWLLNVSLAPAYNMESIYSVDLVSFLVVILLALGLGVVSGLVPARRATRVDPVEILRDA